jgi:NAD(P)-dependent dehydrogenase (short-subunit alcohol dehydrogenase family)
VTTGSREGRFARRVALITGAGSPTGIGFAAARILGREGARVAVVSTTDRSTEQLAGLLRKLLLSEPFRELDPAANAAGRNRGRLAMDS